MNVRSHRTAGIGTRLFMPWIVGWVLCLVGGRLDVQAQAITEQRVKAAYLLRFTQYVEWPTNTFKSDKDPVVIGVLDDEQIEREVAAEARKRSAARPVVVKHFKRVDDVKDCHLLFISNSDRRRLAVITKRLQNTAILTVADAESALDAGVMIRFKKVDGAVRFEVDKKPAVREGLRLDADMLASAVAVRNPDAEGK